MNETIQYLISFLLYGHNEATNLVGYTSDPEKIKQYKVNIRPSDNSPLAHPEKSWEDFYPEVRQVLHQRTITADTDIISVACFLLSRAEEMIITDRDEHGRFLAKHSLLSEGNLLTIPLIDEYSRWMLKRLELPLPEQRITTVNLTHDVDTIALYRHLRGFLGGVKRGHLTEAIASMRDIENDPAFTFGWLDMTDRQLFKNRKNIEVIYFLKASKGKALDYPQYPLKGKDFEALLSYIDTSKGTIGLHSSYAAGSDGNLIKQEKTALEEALKGRINKNGKSLLPEGGITLNRHHWLRSTSIDNMQMLATSGITDDYSMGFADRAGFRLATSRPVRWINPKTLQLTPLTLHPLTIMDCTLSNANYMNLNEEEAFYLCQQLIDKTRQNSGELTLLWHNHIFTEDTYHRSLYKSIIDSLK